jgi:hypothetical protein
MQISCVFFSRNPPKKRLWYDTTTTQGHSAENQNSQVHRCENLKTRNWKILIPLRENSTIDCSAVAKVQEARNIKF